MLEEKEIRRELKKLEKEEKTTLFSHHRYAMNCCVSVLKHVLEEGK